VETTKSKEVKLYQLLPDLPGQKIKGNVLSKGRILVGRTESCEIVIPSGAISAVHAILEITPNGAKVYDMNSKNGTFINDERVVVKNLTPGDKVKFGNISFTFKEYTEPSTLPPVLESLEPKSGKASTIPTIPDILPTELVKLPKAPESVEDDGPYIVYPLASDPKADYSEYIFEDVDELVPIFKYDHGKQAVEIIILFNDKVYSVDYLPESNGVYSIVGSKPGKNEMEFAYLGKDEKVPFVEISNGNCIVHKLHNYTTQHLSDENIANIEDGRVNIQSDDIVRLENGHLEIYVRKVFSPPKVKPAPFFRRDQGLRKYLLLVLLFVFLPLSVLSLFEVEKEKEKDPERIARILYKKPIKKIKMKIVKPKSITKPKPKPMKKKPKKPSKKKVAKQAKKTPKKTVKKVTKKTPGVKTAQKVVKQKKVKKPAPKKAAKPAKVVAKSASKTPKKSNEKPRKSRRPSPKVGRVDTYKSFDFKSTLSSTMAKGGSLRGAKVAKSRASSRIGTTSVGGGIATNLKKADVGTDVGSLTGSTVGKLTQSKGTEGLSAKTGIYTAGIPSETVVLGSMDPDVIRRILREHIPQFRYCYQKELDRRAGRDVSGTIGLIFTIGASGSVSKAGVDQTSGLPGTVKKCVVRVLKGIRFPRPLGGGKVDVKQPFNFMPKRI